MTKEQTNNWEDIIETIINRKGGEKSKIKDLKIFFSNRLANTISQEKERWVEEIRKIVDYDYSDYTYEEMFKSQKQDLKDLLQNK